MNKEEALARFKQDLEKEMEEALKLVDVRIEEYFSIPIIFMILTRFMLIFSRDIIFAKVDLFFIVVLVMLELAHYRIKNHRYKLTKRYANWLVSNDYEIFTEVSNWDEVFDIDDSNNLRYFVDINKQYTFQLNKKQWKTMRYIEDRNSIICVNLDKNIEFGLKDNSHI